jgi:hypothetical protein
VFVQRRGADGLKALGVVPDGREDAVDLVGDAVTTLVFGPAVGGVPVAADRTQRQTEIVRVDLQRGFNAEQVLARGRMCTAERLHRLDLQRVVPDGELNALHLSDQFPVAGNDLLVALAGYVADHGGGHNASPSLTGKGPADRTTGDNTPAQLPPESTHFEIQHQQ